MHADDAHMYLQYTCCGFLLNLQFFVRLAFATCIECARPKPISLQSLLRRPCLHRGPCLAKHRYSLRLLLLPAAATSSKTRVTRARHAVYLVMVCLRAARSHQDHVLKSALISHFVESLVSHGRDSSNHVLKRLNCNKSMITPQKGMQKSGPRCQLCSWPHEIGAQAVIGMNSNSTYHLNTWTPSAAKGVRPRNHGA